MRISYSEAAGEIILNTAIWLITTATILTILYFSKPPNLSFTKYALAIPFITINTLIITYKLFVDGVHHATKKEEN